jgi:hypothetical protein
VAPQLPAAVILETNLEKKVKPATETFTTTKRPAKSKKSKDIVQIFNQLTQDGPDEAEELLTNEVPTSGDGNNAIGQEKQGPALVSTSIYDPRPRTRTYTKNFPKNTAKAKQQLLSKPGKQSQQQQQQQQRSQHQHNNNNNNINTSHHKLPIRSGKKFDHFREKERDDDGTDKAAVKHKQPSESDGPSARERPSARAETGSHVGFFFDPEVAGFEPATKDVQTAKRQEEARFRPRPSPTTPRPAAPALLRIQEPTTPQPIFLNIEEGQQRQSPPFLPSPGPFAPVAIPVAPPPSPPKNAPHVLSLAAPTPSPAFPPLVFQLESKPAPSPRPPAVTPFPATHPPPSPTPPPAPLHHHHPPTPAFPPLVDEELHHHPPLVVQPVAHAVVAHSQDPEYEDYDAREQYKVSGPFINPVKQ